MELNACVKRLVWPGVLAISMCGCDAGGDLGIADDDAPAGGKADDTAGKGQCSAPSAQDCGRQFVGEWSPPLPVPAWGVHTILQPTGKVLMFMGHGLFADYPSQSASLDAVTGEITTAGYTEADDLFCSGHAFLPGGDSVITGGGGGLPNLAIRATQRFDPFSETWTKVGSMRFERWYPTLLTTGDGKILALSGTGLAKAPVEVFDPDTSMWSVIDGTEVFLPETYPSARLLPTGQVYSPGFGFADDPIQNPKARVLTLAHDYSLGSWTDAHAPSKSHEEGGSTFHIDDTSPAPHARLRVYGGGAIGVSGLIPGSETAVVEEVDLTRDPEGARWTKLAKMHHARTNVTALTLPDETVMVVGGQRGGVWNPLSKKIKIPEIYDPQTDTWTEMKAMERPRHYHSAAVLLPDGRVLATGGHDNTKGGAFLGCEGDEAFECDRDLRDYEIFSPPYLFDADGELAERPEIVAVPEQITWGEEFFVETPDGLEIEKAVLITPASITHHMETGRSIRVPIEEGSRGPDGLSIRGPSSPFVAPPGYYMLFLVDARGVPSVARFVQIF